MAVTEVTRNVWDITSTQTAELIPIESNKGAIRSISVSNQHATDDAVLDLYLDDEGYLSANHIYLIKGVKIPAGTTLVMDDVSFNNNSYALYMTNSGGAPLSIIIR